MRRSGIRGFTLIELLVVVSVVVLLMLLAVPRAYSAINTSKQAQVKQDLNVIQQALEQHYVDLGYYPVRLNDLIDRGYIKGGASFRSPVTGRWYFYAVDDNRSLTSAQAYVLGAPGKDAGPGNRLYHARPLPQGRNPGYRANAWLYYKGRDGSLGLNLYNDATDRPETGPLPGNLALYRTSCQDSATTCDLIAN